MSFMLKNLGIKENEFLLNKAEPEYLYNLKSSSVFILGEVDVPEWDKTIINRFCKKSVRFWCVKKYHVILL